MGKASRWFRGLLGLNKPDPNPSPSQNHSQRNTQKKKWSFTMSHKEKGRHTPQQGVDDVNTHAMAVAAATAKVAEAAFAAVQQTGRGKYTSTAAHVSRSGAGYEAGREEWAAVVIQSHFRACLSRQALRALKALVKLQALVRGHLMRKRTAEALRQLQALVRAQTRARGNRVSESPHSSIKSSQFSYHGPETPEKFEHAIRARSMNHEHSMTLKRNGSKSNVSVNYDPAKSHLSRISKMAERYWDERSDKILEVDTGKPPATPKQRRRSLFQSSSHLSLGLDQNCQSPSSIEVQSLSPLKFTEDGVFCTAGNSPTFYSASSMACSSKTEAFTPTKSDGSRSCLSGYSDNPSYMAYTESSKAKLRSLSAPKQRSSQYERSSSTKRYSVHGYGDSRTNQRVSALQANFTNKAYPGSGRLDRLGMPVRDVTGFSGSHWLRY